MLTIEVVRKRLEEIERSMHGLQYAPQAVQDRARLDREVYREMLARMSGS